MQRTLMIKAALIATIGIALLLPLGMIGGDDHHAQTGLVCARRAAARSGVNQPSPLRMRERALKRTAAASTHGQGYTPFPLALRGSPASAGDKDCAPWTRPDLHRAGRCSCYATRTAKHAYREACRVICSSFYEGVALYS